MHLLCVYCSEVVTQVGCCCLVFVHSPGAARAELDLIQRENLQQIISLQAEMERGKEALRHFRQHPPPAPHPDPLQTKPPTHAPPSLVHSLHF